MRSFRTRKSHVLLAIVALAVVSAVSYPLYKSFEGPIRIAVGLPPPSEILSFDVDKYHVEVVRNWHAAGTVLISSGPHVWNLKRWHLGAYEFSSGSFFYPADSMEDHGLPKSKKPVLSKDINSDGWPEVVIMSDMVGEMDFTDVYVLRLGNQIDCLLRLPRAYYVLHLSDEDSDGNMEILVTDYGLKWWSTWGSCTPDVPVVYRWRNGSYYVATPEFHAKYAPLIEVKERAYPAVLVRAQSAGFHDRVASQMRPPAEMWEIMLDYIYLGDGLKARETFDRLWPPGLLGKDEALADFDRLLRNNALWEETNDVTAPEKRWPPVNPPPPPAPE